MECVPATHSLLSRWREYRAPIAAFAFSVGITATIFAYREKLADLAGFGYLGIFLISVLSNATIAFPVPGIAAVFAGGLAGFMTGAFVSGGPPIIYYLYARAKDPRTMKATVQTLFIGLMLYRAILIMVGGRCGSPELVGVLWATPVAVATLLAGHWLSLRGSPARFRKVSFAMLGLFGLLAMGKGVAELIGV